MRRSLTLGVTLVGFVLCRCATSVGPGAPSSAANSGTGDQQTDLDSGAPASGSGSSVSSGSNASTGSNPGPVSSGSSASSGASSSGSSASGASSDLDADSTGAGADSTTTTSNGGGTNPSDQYLPKVSGTCPTIATGMQNFAGEPVQIWAGKPTADQHGPLVLFWFETLGKSSDATLQFGQAQINAVMAQGGIVASFAKSNGMGTDTGDAVWFTGDFNTADQVVACAIQQFHIDTRRIFTTGASAGALQATYMAYVRSGYIAAAATLSGGTILAPPLQDSTNVPAAMATHGAPGADVVIIDFANASAAWESDVAKKGGFSVDCNTGGGHVSGPPAICPAIWQFFEDHPFKVKPEPYPPLPSVFPSYCKIGPRLADGGAP